MDTVELNRSIQSDNQNLYSFVPFHGTPLRKICEEMGLVAPSDITRALTDRPMLTQEQYPPEEIEALQKCFVFYVKFSKSRWNDIKRAEPNTPEGNRIYEDLRQEYFDKYSEKAETSHTGQTASSADLEYGMEAPESSS